MKKSTAVDLNREERATLLQEKANAFHFLAELYNQRPDKKFVANLKTFGTERIQKMAEMAGVDESVAEGFSLISSYINSIQDRSIDGIEEDLAVDWTRLFRGVSPDYGPKPPFESVYLAAGKEDQGQMTRILSSLMSEYGREKVIINKESANRPDYIGLELGFLGFLSEKEAEAWLQGEEGLAEEYDQRISQFVKTHLGKWIAAFCKEVEKYAETDFYMGVIKITQGMVDEFSSTKIKNAGNQQEVVEVFNE